MYGGVLPGLHPPLCNGARLTLRTTTAIWQEQRAEREARSWSYSFCWPTPALASGMLHDFGPVFPAPRFWPLFSPFFVWWDGKLFRVINACTAHGTTEHPSWQGPFSTAELQIMLSASYRVIAVSRHQLLAAGMSTDSQTLTLSD